MDDPDALPDGRDGRWHMFTESGTHYELDLVGRTVLRNPGSGELRRDGDVMALWALGRLEVGMEAVMILNLREDGIPTVRTTSPVTALIPAEPTDPA